MLVYPFTTIKESSAKCKTLAPIEVSFFQLLRDLEHLDHAVPVASSGRCLQNAIQNRNELRPSNPIGKVDIKLAPDEVQFFRGRLDRGNLFLNFGRGFGNQEIHQ